MKMSECPNTGLLLPTEFIDEKQSLKKSIDSVVQEAVGSMSHVKDNYFLVIHAKFDVFDPTTFRINAPVVSYKLPPFISNQFVFWVSPKRGIVELLWMVAPRKKGEKLKVEFNKEGVAYLQAKGAMPS
jgi:hypothetical protein